MSPDADEEVKSEQQPNKDEETKTDAESVKSEEVAQTQSMEGDTSTAEEKTAATIENSKDDETKSISTNDSEAKVGSNDLTKIPGRTKNLENAFQRAQSIVDICLDMEPNENGEYCVDISEPELEWLLDTSKDLILSQSNLLHLRAPMNIIGDIHGQYSDLLRVFESCGWPKDSHFLFLGDYVDRGKNGLECCVLLLALKVQYPGKVFLLRGNHECASINRVYGFYEEVKSRFGQNVWFRFCNLFDNLPIAALVEERIFCIHGGLSPDLIHLDQIAAMERPLEVPDHGLLCDFLWSDPDGDVEGWAESDRGVSHTFGADIVQDFLRTHDLDLIVRAHQVVEDGYEFFADRGLVTIFSAPNYCGEFDNAGAILNVAEDLLVSFTILKPLQSIEFGYVGVETVAEKRTSGKQKRKLVGAQKYQNHGG